MSLRSFFLLALFVGIAPGIAHAQTMPSIPDPLTGQQACQQQKSDFASHTDFGSSPVWRSVHVKSGKFSVELPFSDKWRMDGQTLLPYSLYDNGTGSARITVNGQSSDEARAIHFGRYRIDDVQCSPEITIPTLTAMTTVREFSLSWQAQKSLASVIKSAQTSTQDQSAPLSIRVGKTEGVLVHGHVELFGLSCTQDTLWFNLKGKTFSLTSTCRPLSFELLRVAASLKLDR